MLQPKYSFYIGSADSNLLYFYEGSIIDDTGQFIHSTSSYCSSIINATTNNLYINYRVDDVYDSFIALYDKDNNYIGSIYIDYKSLAGVYSDKTIITLPSETKYIRLVLSKSNTNVDEIIQKNFIYFMNLVRPHYDKLSKKYSKESGQEFFRQSLDGKINLYGYDYDIVKNASVEAAFMFIINKYSRSENKWAQYYKGEFNKTDCKFEYDNKKCELSISSVDEYTDILNNYESTYDLIKLAPEIEKINLNKRPLVQVYILGANSISNFFGGIYWEADVNQAISDKDKLVNDYYFTLIQSGNEFYVNNAGVPEANGVYAGTGGYWDNWDGCTCYAEEDESLGTSGDLHGYYIYIKRNIDGKILYKSESPVASTFYDVHLEKSVKMVNIEDVNDSFTIEDPFVYSIYQRLLCDVNTIEDSEGIKNTYDLPIDDFVADNRNYKKCIGLKGGLFFCTSRTIDEPTKYGINDYNKYFTNKFIPSTTGYGRALPICRNTWANASLWYIYDIFYDLFEKQLRKQYELRDSYSIASVIKALLKKVNPNIKHEATEEYSRFLYSSNVPIAMDRFYVYITPKSNVLKGNYDQAAQKAEITLKDVMEMLRNCFRCYWYIEDNKLKIEHISFFLNGKKYIADENSGQSYIDFINILDQFNKKPALFFQSSISFDKSELAQRYEFSWMDDVTDLFGQVTADILSNYIQKDKVEEISVSQFSSDVDFMLFNPSNFSDGGFALLCPIRNENGQLELPIITVYNLIDENGDTYNATAQNWYASWIYLINFYMYDMPARLTSINVLGERFANGIKKCMEHSIQLPLEDDINEQTIIRTSIGEGKIDGMSINLDTRITDIDLLYNPD